MAFGAVKGAQFIEVSGSPYISELSLHNHSRCDGIILRDVAYVHLVSEL